MKRRKAIAHVIGPACVLRRAYRTRAHGSRRSRCIRSPACSRRAGELRAARARGRIAQRGGGGAVGAPMRRRARRAIEAPGSAAPNRSGGGAPASPHRRLGSTLLVAALWAVVGRVRCLPFCATECSEHAAAGAVGAKRQDRAAEGRIRCSISGSNLAVYNQPLPDAALVACPHCDLLQRLPELVPGASARCPRCDKELWRRREDSLERTLALALAAAVLCVVANFVPMLGLSAVGRAGDRRRARPLHRRRRAGAPDRLHAGDRTRSATRTTAGMGRDASPLSPYHRHVEHDRGHDARRAGRAHQDRGLREGDPGAGAVRARRARLRARGDAGELRSARGLGQDRVGGGGRPDMSTPAATAMTLGLQGCHACGLVSRPVPGADEGSCPRCGDELSFRKSASLQRTWAFLIAAAVCYVPANVLPVLTTVTASGRDSDTILQGVVLLWSPTGWPLSLIVLVASIMIPSAKIVALVYLLVTVQRGSVESNVQRVRLYRMVELIGRWSMVDVFVDTFTAALVQLQPLMSVEPGPGLLFFAAVVVLTMLAVESFDPRLIWDAASGAEVQRA